MPKYRPMSIQDLAQGRAIKARALFLCLLMLLGSVGVASHVHGPVELDLHEHASEPGRQDYSESALVQFVVEDCDQFHMNSWAALEALPSHTNAYFGREVGLVETFSADSISPELFPPARAPPSKISLT